MFEDIAAISSGLIDQPIGVVRVTGPGSVAIVRGIFTGKVGGNKEITFGKIVEGERVVDEVLIAWFIGSDNAVGQNLVEIYCHGGTIVTTTILQLLISRGARLAEPGEFSKIAFLNGKMDLVKAEAIHDLIYAKTRRQAELSTEKFSGSSSELIKQLIAKITHLIGVCEVNIDYPEYDDIEEADNSFLKREIEAVGNEIERVIVNSERSQVFFTGLRVSIVGKPNVGKSSILNLLLGEERAIVTDIPGTTRDYVEGEIVIADVVFKLIDTAGLRETENQVERLGIERSLKQIEGADIILHILDEREEDDYDREVARLSNDKHYKRIVNKRDLLNNSRCREDVCVSAKEGDIQGLRGYLEGLVPTLDHDLGSYLNNSRQIGQLKKALNSLKDALRGIELGHDVGIIIIDIRQAWEDLQKILGNASNEQLLDAIFSSFCLGK